MIIVGLCGIFIHVTSVLRLMLCSSPIFQMAITLRTSIGIRLNNVPLLISCLFDSQPSSRNVVAVCFGKIMARPGALIFGCPGFQLQHASLGAVPQPPGATLGAGLQLDILVENLM